MSYETIVGLEIHAQAKTKSKMFCGCSANYFEAEPNSHTCPTCLGLPGALPVPNRAAIDLCVKLGLALNCEINHETKFDRKNYFYPDLPKGYQISQYDQPVAENGYIEIAVEGEKRRIGITRVHQEEDTGKSIHSGSNTLLDYNKSGVPLIEIVTEPDFRSGAEVVAFGRKLRQILRYLDISDADMEKGQMRVEPNISVRKEGVKKLPDYKVEVKNIASISVLDKVVDLEVARHIELLESGQTPTQETRGLLDMTGKTISQRTKETASDYRYFPEPDIPLIEFSDEYIEEIRKTISELPEERRIRYQKLGYLSSKDIELFINEPEIGDHFNAALEGQEEDKKFGKAAAKWTKNARTYAKKHDRDIRELDPKFTKELAEMEVSGKTPSMDIKSILSTKMTAITYWEGDDKKLLPKEILEKEELASVSDEGALEPAIDKVIADNPKAVEDVKKNPKAVMFLVGQVMKEMKGKADPNTVRGMLEEKINK